MTCAKTSLALGLSLLSLAACATPKPAAPSAEAKLRTTVVHVEGMT